ncbi:MAG: twin-arginine translocase TatA/TatE family subunit [Solirubrobacterales bacterium]
MSFGPLEIGIIVLVVLLLFGARKLPQMGRGLGRGMREFKQGITGEDEAGELSREPEREQPAFRETPSDSEKSSPSV